jgi:exopolysaccharide biosynthesis polyprenyl glycosylphosphotransferase
LNSKTPKISFCLFQVIGDLFFLNASIILAYLIRFYWVIPQYNFLPYLRIFPIISILALLLFNFYNLYNTIHKLWSEILASLVVSLGLLMLSAVAISFMAGGYSFPRSVFLIALVLQLLTIGAWRWIMLLWERKLVSPRRVILVALNHEVEILYLKIKSDHHQIIGTITNHWNGTEGGNKIVGTFENITEICNRLQPDSLIISGNIPGEIKNIIIHKSFKYGWDVLVIPGLYEIMVSQTKLDQIQDTMVFKISPEVNQGREQIKRWLDFILAMTCLIIALPVIVLIAIAIKLDSFGPIFYKQERVSKFGRHFMLYKFRTMVKNAEQKTGPVLAADNDSRITRIGRFVRAVRLDEIPQLFNVIKGDMSLVGPRPERPFFVEQFETMIPEYKFRHLTYPGITGLAQVFGKYSTSPEDKLRYDLFYIKETSPLFDLKIMLQTIKILLIKGKAS